MLRLFYVKLFEQHKGRKTWVYVVKFLEKQVDQNSVVKTWKYSVQILGEIIHTS